MKLPVLYIPEKLPCHPCPHDAPCCTHGTTLSVAEALGIAETFGPGVISYLKPKELLERGWFDPALPPREGLWGTNLNASSNRCVLYAPGKGCRAHDHPYYPAACRTFPWKDPLDTTMPQAWDAPLCPETKKYP